MLSDFIISHENDDVNRLALQHNRYPQFSDEDWHFILQQIEGRQKAKDKLPAFYAANGIIYPRRLSMEQCSSEITALYKQQLITQPAGSFADLTGGFGVDTYYLSRRFGTAHYVEQNSELCSIARHNFDVLNAGITVHNQTAQDFLAQTGRLDLIFIDPARRNTAGKKVFRIADCEPDMFSLWQTIQSRSSRQMVKLSPMIEIKELINSRLSPDRIHIIAVGNECKEVLLLASIGNHSGTVITAANICNGKTDIFSFTPGQETSAQPVLADSIRRYLYEPNAAILKAGAYKLISQQYNIGKLARNSHLYTSDSLIAEFPGRIWAVEPLLQKPLQANVMVRNYPLAAEALKKKLHIKDGGGDYVIGTTLGNKPVLLHGSRIDL